MAGTSSFGHIESNGVQLRITSAHLRGVSERQGSTIRPDLHLLVIWPCALVSIRSGCLGWLKAIENQDI